MASDNSLKELFVDEGGHSNFAIATWVELDGDGNEWSLVLEFKRDKQIITSAIGIETHYPNDAALCPKNWDLSWLHPM